MKIYIIHHFYRDNKNERNSRLGVALKQFKKVP